MMNQLATIDNLSMWTEIGLIKEIPVGHLRGGMVRLSPIGEVVGWEEAVPEVVLEPFLRTTCLQVITFDCL